MLGQNSMPTAIPYAGSVPAQVTHQPDRQRVVESTEKSTLDASANKFNALRLSPIVQLLRNSADRFAEVLELTEDLPTAQVVTGLNTHMPAYRHIDLQA